MEPRNIVRRHCTNGALVALSGPRELVARAVSQELADEYLADVLLRTATEKTVSAISFRERLGAPTRFIELDVEAIYAHPAQGLQCAAMHAIGGWNRVATHPEAWRREGASRSGRPESTAPTKSDESES